MSVAFTLVESWDDIHKRHLIGTVAFTNNYATGGETLDLSGKGAVSRPPIEGQIEGIAGFKYEWAVGTTLANGKVLIRTNDAGGANAAMAQHTAAAVVAGVTGDTIRAHFIFSKE